VEWQLRHSDASELSADKPAFRKITTVQIQKQSLYQMHAPINAWQVAWTLTGKPQTELQM
jgi:hypothetical protein